MKLQGIIDVKYAEDPALDMSSEMMLASYAGQKITAAGPWQDAEDDRCHGEFTDSEELVNGRLVHTSTLTFQLKDNHGSKLPLGNVPNAWKFRDRAGEWRMLGNGDRPYPLALMNTDNGSGNTETHTITVTWRSFTGALTI